MNEGMRYKLDKECRAATGYGLCSWLQSAYQGWGMPVRLIGEMLGVSGESVSNWLQAYKIRPRGKNEMMILKWKHEHGVA
jgi:hypothetical protein